MNLHSHRKDEHVMIAEKLYRQKSTNGLERIRLIPANLPEISLDEISLSTTLAGKKLEAPFFIYAITGGSQTTEQDRGRHGRRISERCRQKRGLCQGF